MLNRTIKFLIENRLVVRLLLKYIEEHRKEFHFLFQALIQLLKVFGLKSDTLYEPLCQIAYNNQGVDWLRKYEKTFNSYFGEKLFFLNALRYFRCGLQNPTMQNQFNVQFNSIHIIIN